MGQRQNVPFVRLSFFRPFFHGEFYCELSFSLSSFFGGVLFPQGPTSQNPVPKDEKKKNKMNFEAEIKLKGKKNSHQRNRKWAGWESVLSRSFFHFSFLFFFFYQSKKITNNKKRKCSFFGNSGKNKDRSALRFLKERGYFIFFPFAGLIFQLVLFFFSKTNETDTESAPVQLEIEEFKRGVWDLNLSKCEKTKKDES